MKAAVLRAPLQLGIEDIPEPAPFGEQPVLVRVGAVGVCGSDLLRYKGGAYHYPLVLGHEFSAVVERPAAGGRLKAGDRVAVYPLLPKDDDPLTAVGEWALSADYDYFGSRRDGGMEERLYVPEANLLPLPEGMSLVDGAIVEPTAVALHGVRKLHVPSSGAALVVGAGPIGALAAQWLRILGWSRVLVADIDPRKLAVVDRLGFETVDARLGTVAQARDLTQGRGVDAAVEASGLPLTFRECLESVAPRGQVLLLGDLKGDAVIPRDHISSFIRREVTLYGTWNSKLTPVGANEWTMAAERIARGDVQVRHIVSHVLPLPEVPDTFSAMSQGGIWTNKVVFAVDERARAEAEATA